MVTVKNISGGVLERPFEGQTYTFTPDQIVLVDEKLADHLKEVWPLSFEYDVKVAKGRFLAKVKHSKTDSVLNEVSSVDMEATQYSRPPQGLAPDIEAQGADFYGPGVEEDDLEA